jgi:phage portal protein BeeE
MSDRLPAPPRMTPLTKDSNTNTNNNNTQTMLDEFYKTVMYPMITNIEQKLKQQLFRGYPNLFVKFDTKDFLKGAALDQMSFVSGGVKSGIITPNEAREYMGYPQIENGDDLVSSAAPGADDPIGRSPQDTGGGGGNQRRKMNIGTT